MKATQRRLAGWLKVRPGEGRVLLPVLVMTFAMAADEQVRRADLDAIRVGLDDQAFEATFAEGHAAKFEDLEAMANAVSVRGSGS